MPLNEVLIAHVARTDSIFRRPGKEWLCVDKSWKFRVAEGNNSGEEVIPSAESMLANDWEVADA